MDIWELCQQHIQRVVHPLCEVLLFRINLIIDIFYLLTQIDSLVYYKLTIQAQLSTITENI